MLTEKEYMKYSLTALANGLILNALESESAYNYVQVKILCWHAFISPEITFKGVQASLISTCFFIALQKCSHLYNQKGSNIRYNRLLTIKKILTTQQLKKCMVKFIIGKFVSLTLVVA
jgi:hypothetical protein